MEELMKIFGRLAFVLLAVWVVLAGLGMTTMPGTKKQRVQTGARKRGKGAMWAQAVASAPGAEDNLSFPAAYVM
jgi:hypothetical protein